MRSQLRFSPHELTVLVLVRNIGFVFLFFFMEETNYRRKPSPSKFDTSADSPFNNSRIDVKTTEESRAKLDIGDVAVVNVECNPPEDYNRKSYLDKLKVFETKQSQYPNRLKGMILRPIIFLSFPVIFYAGFSYGSHLIWFNVLNGTASLILSEEPYEISSSTIGLAYLSPFIGITAA